MILKCNGFQLITTIAKFIATYLEIGNGNNLQSKVVALQTNKNFFEYSSPLSHSPTISPHKEYAKIELEFGIQLMSKLFSPHDGTNWRSTVPPWFFFVEQ